MTPKEKGKELVKRYFDTMAYETMSPAGRKVAWGQAKKCAMICVDEILASFENKLNKPLDEVYQAMSTPIGISEITEPYKHFCQQVKQEIETL